jgi:D-alanyl-D-alanine carboxypeptidase
MRTMTGRLDPIRLLASEGGRTSLLVRSERDGHLRFDFRIEEGPPPVLQGISIDQADPDEQSEEPRQSLAQFAHDLDEHLSRETTTDRFSGVVLVARDSTILFLQPYGYADRERRVANNTETKFNLGSINKTFTALAIRQLAAEGKLRLTDTLKNLLVDYPNEDAARSVTVQHLLTMRSGIGDFFGPRYEATPKESLMTISSYLPLFADLPLAFPPGTQNRYSNGGYIVLGAIIEAVSGMDYYHYVREHIFEPAGMAQTASYAKNVAVANRAVGYTRRGPGDGLQRNDDSLPGRGSSAGGGYSTAMDLFRYVQALREARICRPEDPAREGFGVAGGAPGINAAFDWNPEEGTVIVVLTNLDPPAAERVSRRIRAWLPRS